MVTSRPSSASRTAPPTRYASTPARSAASRAVGEPRRAREPLAEAVGRYLALALPPNRACGALRSLPYHDAPCGCPPSPRSPPGGATPLHLAIIAAVSLIGVGGAFGAYAAFKRDADRSCPPPCTLEVERGAARRPTPKQVETVDWPLYGYDTQRTRYLPTKRVKPPFDASEWSFQAGKLLEFSPIVAKGTLYFQDKDALFYALSADKGKVEWKKDIGGLGAASPAYSHGVVYAVTLQRAPGVDEGEALALRAKDGKLLWRFPLPGRSETSPIVVGSNVIVGSESGDVFALDRKTGKPDWQVSTAGAVKGGLALDDGVLYGANYAGEVFALRASSGASVWRSSTQGSSFGRGGPVYSTPAVAFGRVYLGSDRQPRLLLRPGHRRAALEPLDRRLGLRGARRSPTRPRPTRPSTSAPRTRTSTRSTRRPARCAGRSGSAA